MGKQRAGSNIPGHTPHGGGHVPGCPSFHFNLELISEDSVLGLTWVIWRFPGAIEITGKESMSKFVTIPF